MTKSSLAKAGEPLRRRAEETLKERKKLKLEGVVGDLECLIVNVEPDNLESAVDEFLCSTGYDLSMSFEDARSRTCVLGLDGSADILVRSRKVPNPFLGLDGPKSRRLPNTRLETYVFGVTDLERFLKAQRKRGVDFLRDDMLRYDNFIFNQTKPSPHSGNSIGFIEWTGRRGEYFSSDAEGLEIGTSKPADCFCLGSIGRLDHAATRLKAESREDALIEFIGLTNYAYDSTIHAETTDSLTSVARLGPDGFAMVFTSGAGPDGSGSIGPAEAFVRDYGPRTHHLAFQTEDLDGVVEELKENGLGFHGEIVGSSGEGLRQVFTSPRPSTLLVAEYIQRFNDFDGFYAAPGSSDPGKAASH